MSSDPSNALSHDLQRQIQNLKDSYASLRAFAESLHTTSPSQQTYSTASSLRSAWTSSAHQHEDVSSTTRSVLSSSERSAATESREFGYYKRFPSAPNSQEQTSPVTPRQAWNQASPERSRHIGLHDSTLGQSSPSSVRPSAESPLMRSPVDREGVIDGIQRQLSYLAQAIAEIQMKVDSHEQTQLDLQRELLKEKSLNQTLTKIVEGSIVASISPVRTATRDPADFQQPYSQEHSDHHAPLPRGLSFPKSAQDLDSEEDFQDVTGAGYDLYTIREESDIPDSAEEMAAKTLGSKQSPSSANVKKDTAKSSPTADSKRKSTSTAPKGSAPTNSVRKGSTSGSTTTPPDQKRSSAQKPSTAPQQRTARSASIVSTRSIGSIGVGAKTEIIEEDAKARGPEWREGLCASCRKSTTKAECHTHPGVYGRCACHDKSVSGGMWTRSAGCLCRNMKAACSDCKSSYPVPKLHSNLAAAKKADYFHKHRCECWCHKLWSCCGVNARDAEGCRKNESHQPNP